jgi:hypothetical protein
MHAIAEEQLSSLAGKIIIGAYQPLYKKEWVQQIAKSGVTCFSLDMLPRTTRAQSMDILSSQANIAGYKAVLLAAYTYGRYFPMFMTAAGSITPAKVLILGAGATASSLTLAALDFSDHVSVTNRNDARTDELIKRDWPKKVHKVLWEDRETAAKEVGLIVNTTSVGLVNDDSPLRYWPENSSADLYDLIYRPKLTMIQEQAKASSGVVVDGLSHLQGHIEATMNVLGISLADPRALHNIMSDIAGRPPLRWEKP